MFTVQKSDLVAPDLSILLLTYQKNLIKSCAEPSFPGTDVEMCTLKKKKSVMKTLKNLKNRKQE